MDTMFTIIFTSKLGIQGHFKTVWSSLWLVYSDILAPGEAESGERRPGEACVYLFIYFDSSDADCCY